VRIRSRRPARMLRPLWRRRLRSCASCDKDTLGSVHTTPGSTASASPRGWRRAPRSSPTARGARESHRPWGDRRVGAHRQCAPCLTASTPAPMSPPAIGTPRCGVL